MSGLCEHGPFTVRKPYANLATIIVSLLRNFQRFKPIRINKYASPESCRKSKIYMGESDASNLKLPVRACVRARCAKLWPRSWSRAQSARRQRLHRMDLVRAKGRRPQDVQMESEKVCPQQRVVGTRSLRLKCPRWPVLTWRFWRWGDR